MWDVLIDKVKKADFVDIAMAMLVGVMGLAFLLLVISMVIAKVASAFTCGC